MNDKISSEDLLAIKNLRSSLKIAELELNNTILKIFFKYGLSINDTINEIDGSIIKQQDHDL